MADIYPDIRDLVPGTYVATHLVTSFDTQCHVCYVSPRISHGQDQMSIDSTSMISFPAEC